MIHRRQSIASYALPISSFLLAAAVHLIGKPLEHAPATLRILASFPVIALVFATVFVVLNHADAVARRVGEPYGTLLLTIAVTAIEVSIIVSMMLHGENNPTLARESVFSTVMIVTTGLVGACLTLGGWRHRKQDLMRQGTSAFLSVLIALTVLSLVLPNYTLATSPGTFSASQLAFVSLLSVLLYGSFVLAQTVRHRDDFVDDAVDGGHGHGSTDGKIATHLILLFVGLAGIVLLTELVAAGIEDGLNALQFARSDAIVGALIATVVLMPEGVSAIRAALRNELQRSLNIALGSACATIGLTIPAVATASLFTGRDLTLGLEARDTVMLVLALSICVVSFGTGRTTILTGLVHLVVFVAYLFLIVVP